MTRDETRVMVVVFKAISNNISAVSFIGGRNGVPEDNHRLAVSH